MRPPLGLRILAVALLGGSVGCEGVTDGADTSWDPLLRVLPLEDARPRDAAGREALIALTQAGDAATRALAVRALGRLEAPELVEAIASLSSDPDPSVRAEAAWALAQAVHGSDGAPALAPLLAAARSEEDQGVRGELARSLGRIRPGGTGSPEALTVLLAWMGSPAGPTGESAEGWALGLEGLTRAPGPTGSDDRLHEALDALARRAPAPGEDEETAARSRAVAVLGLGQRGRLSPATLRAALEDPHAGVRVAAARFLGAVPPAQQAELIARALADPVPGVRIEAVGTLAVDRPDAAACRRLLEVARSDRLPIVRAVALEALGRPCPEPLRGEALGHLEALASSLDGTADAAVGALWFEPATALAALVLLEPERARTFLASHLTAQNPFARAAAAGVAGVLGDVQALETLARDPDPNVRTAALPALFELQGRALDPLLVAQFADDDGQLLLTVAGLLSGSDHPGAAEAALDAFERLSRTRRETARDARMALLALLRVHGTADLAGALTPYLADYDPAVADEVAATLRAWTGAAADPRPARPPRLALPDAADLDAMASSLVVLRMARGGEIAVALDPMLAPTNAYRFFRLASEGWFDGLTFHRVVPNFVIQGGSPGANEYAGDGPFTRDEIGRVSHWRGTVGLSTRGRDTGDGQIFVNLVDNVRLDHDYTVFGTVVNGLEVVDQVLPGDVIERVEIRPRD